MALGEKTWTYSMLGGYMAVDGTSIATAQVTGAVTRVLQVKKDVHYDVDNIVSGCRGKGTHDNIVKEVCSGNYIHLISQGAYIADDDYSKAVFDNENDYYLYDYYIC